MPVVSILIPAIKPEFLVKSLRSALEQTFTDTEILVGDDTPDARLRPILESIGDSRIQYFHHGFQNGVKNTQGLWDKASGKYIKWLFDDDLIMPTSIETLVRALEAHPDSAMAFHQFVFIDENDKVTRTPPALLPQDSLDPLDRRHLVSRMVVSLDNFIGAPSNTLLVREKINQKSVRKYGAYHPLFLTDVAMYLSYAAHAPVILTGGYLSAFRQHTGQASGAASPIRAAGCYEWEVFIRGEAAAGNIQTEELIPAQQRLKRLYEAESKRLPELLPFIKSLEELTTLPPEELPFSPHFEANVIAAQTTIARRIAERRKSATMAAVKA